MAPATRRLLAADAVMPTEVVWTANGNGFGPWRYAVLFNDLPGIDESNCYPFDPSAPDLMIGWKDYGRSVVEVDKPMTMGPTRLSSEDLELKPGEEIDCRSIIIDDPMVAEPIDKEAILRWYAGEL
jgi:hypothetical protein